MMFGKYIKLKILKIYEKILLFFEIGLFMILGGCVKKISEKIPQNIPKNTSSTEGIKNNEKKKKKAKKELYEGESAIVPTEGGRGNGRFFKAPLKFEYHFQEKKIKSNWERWKKN